MGGLKQIKTLILIMCRCKTQALEAGQITGTWAILPGISHPYLCAQPPHRRWAPGGAQHPEAWGEEWGDRVSAAQGAGARVLVRLLCWSQSLPAPGLVLIRALSCFMAYISVVCVVAGEEAAFLSSGAIGRARCVCWLSAGWAKQSLLPNGILSPCLRGLG